MMLFTTLVLSFLVCASTTELCLSLQPGHYSSLTAPHLQHTTNQDRHDQCGKQHHSRELLMMGIVMPIRSTIKYQVASGWFFDSSVITMLHGPINIRQTSNLLKVSISVRNSISIDISNIPFVSIR